MVPINQDEVLQLLRIVNINTYLFIIIFIKMPLRQIERRP